MRHRDTRKIDTWKINNRAVEVRLGWEDGGPSIMVVCQEVGLNFSSPNIAECRAEAERACADLPPESAWKKMIRVTVGGDDNTYSDTARNAEIQLYFDVFEEARRKSDKKLFRRQRKGNGEWSYEAVDRWGIRKDEVKIPWTEETEAALQSIAHTISTARERLNALMRQPGVGSKLSQLAARQIAFVESPENAAATQPENETEETAPPPARDPH